MSTDMTGWCALCRAGSHNTHNAALGGICVGCACPVTAADRPSVTDNARDEEPLAWCPGCGDRIPTRVVRERGVCSECWGTRDDPWAAGRTDRPSVTDNALADAWDEGHRTGWEHCQDGNYGNDYWDDPTPNPYAAAARAETTTATTEDAEEVLHGAGWFARADLDPRDLRGILHDLADADLLATARTRPTREQIIDALVMSPLSDTAGTDMRPFEQTADAVLALYADQPETTTEDVLDSLPYFTFEDDDVAPDEEFVRKADVARLLATARTRPTRYEVARAIRLSRTNGLCKPGVRCDLCDCAQEYEDDLALRDADAVLALYADQPETTTEWGVRFYGRGPFDVACDSREDAEAEVAAVEDKHAPAVLIRREVTAWTEADRG